MSFISAALQKCRRKVNSRCARPAIRAPIDSLMTSTVAMDMMTAQRMTATVSSLVRPTGNLESILCMRHWANASTPCRGCVSSFPDYSHCQCQRVQSECCRKSHLTGNIYKRVCCTASQHTRPPEASHARHRDANLRRLTWPVRRKTWRFQRL